MSKQSTTQAAQAASPTVMPQRGRVLQRACACGQHASGGECAECRKKRQGSLQRAAVTSAPPRSAPPIVQTVLRAAGQPLAATTRAAMEPRFKHDFSRVRVHTDPQAAQSARAVDALAYTVGSDVVFGAGQYAPDTTAGRRLLAHELTHVVQQQRAGAASAPQMSLRIGSPDTAAEQQAEAMADRICAAGASARPADARRLAGAPTPLPSPDATLQRRVSPRMPAIKDKLTYGFFDWAIRDAEAHDVIMILKALNDADLRDTVAAMERERLVDRLFDNASEADRSAEADTLQRVQNVRVHTKTVTSGSTTVTVMGVGSCSLEQANALNLAISTALNWLDTAIARLNDFLNAPLTRRAQSVGQSLQTHFHTQNRLHAELIRDRMRTIKTEATSRRNFTSECAAPTDPLCTALAAAYTSGNTGVRWCTGFFSASAEWQARNIIHESSHAFLEKVIASATDRSRVVQDRAYFDERIYEFLRPEEAMDNADSYARLAHELVAGRPLSGAEAGRRHDSVADCPAGAYEMVRPALARAARWNLNAINILPDPRPDFRAGYADLRRKHFGTDDPARIPDLLKAYQSAKEEFDRDIPFECEKAGGACSGSTIGYFRSFIHTSDLLHLCPRWFGLGDVQQVEALYALVLSHDAGVSQADRYKYVGLANDLTQRYWPMPSALPTNPFPTSNTPGTRSPERVSP